MPNHWPESERLRQSLVMKKRMGTKSAKRASSIRSQKMWSDNTARERVLSGMRLAWSTPEKKAMLSSIVKKRWKQPGFRKRVSNAVTATLLENYTDTAYLEKHSQALLSYYATHKVSKETRRKQSISACLRHSTSNGTKRYVSGHFDSKKMGRKFWYRSSWELARMNVLERDKDVVSYFVESLLISYVFDGIERFCKPDFAIIRTGGLGVLEEVKASLDMHDRKRTLCKIRAMRRWCEKHGWEFRLLTSLEVINAPTD